MSDDDITITSDSPTIEIVDNSINFKFSATGPAGAVGPGVPAGGTTGQVLTKASGTSYDTLWATPSGGGAVSSVFGRTGAVVAVSGDYNIGQITGASTVAATGAYADLTGKPTLGTAAAKAASNNAKASLASVDAATTAGHLAIFTDTAGTVGDGGAPPSIPVTSVFGRTGAVVATNGDYTIGQITGAGQAAAKAVSDNSQSTVASLSGLFSIGHIAVFADNAGTIKDGGPPVFSNKSNTLVMFGDSMIELFFDVGDVAPNVTRTSVGFMSSVQYTMGERLKTNVNLCLGFGGNTTQNLIDSHLAELGTAIAANPGCVVMTMFGVNDAYFSTVTQAQSLINVGIISKYILERGAIWAPVLTMYWGGAAGTMTAPQIAQIDAINTQILGICAANPNCYPTDARSGYVITTMTVDGLHTNAVGGLHIGQPAGVTLANIYGTATLPTTLPNLIPNPNFLGTGGTNGTSNLIITGGIPDNMMVTSATDVADTLAFSRDAGGNLIVTYSSSNKTALQRVSLEITANVAYQPTDSLQAFLDMQTLAATNCLNVGCNLFDDATTDANIRGFGYAADYGPNGWPLFPRGIAASDPHTPGAGSTALKFKIELYLNALSQSASVQVKLFGGMIAKMNGQLGDLSGMSDVGGITPTQGNIMVFDGTLLQSRAIGGVNQVVYLDSNKYPKGNSGFTFNDSNGLLVVTQISNPVGTYQITTDGHLVFAGVTTPTDGGGFLVNDAGTFNPYNWQWGSNALVGQRLTQSTGTSDFTDLTGTPQFSIYLLTGNIKMNGSIILSTNTQGNIMTADGTSFSGRAVGSAKQVVYLDASKYLKGNSEFTFDDSTGLLKATQFATTGATWTISAGGLMLFAGTVTQYDGGKFLVEDAGTFWPYIWAWASATLLGERLTAANGSIDLTDNTGAPLLRRYPLVGDMELTRYLIWTGNNTSGKIPVANGTGFTPVAVSGDATLASNGALTLATVNSNTGSFGSSTAIPTITVNAKGLITAVTTNAVIAPAGTLTGTTLAATVVTSSLTAVGTIVTGVWNGTAVDATHGGTGLSSWTQGDIPFASATNTIAALAKSASNTRSLCNTGTSNAPAWDQVSLSDGVKNRLPFANIATLAGFSVLGNATTGAATMAAITASSADQVLTMNAAGTLLRFGALNLAGASAVTGLLPAANVATGTSGAAIPLLNGNNTWSGTSTYTKNILLAAGTTTAGTSPIKFQSGTNMTTGEAGAMEYNGTNLFFTRSGTTREGVLIGNRGATAPSTSVGVGIVNYYGASATNFLGDPNTWFSVVGDNGTTYKIPAYT